MGRPGQSYRILPKTKAKHGHLIKATPLTTLPLFPHTHTHSIYTPDDGNAGPDK